MDFLHKKLKGYIVVDKEGTQLLDKLKNDPYSYILNEARFDMSFNNKTSSYLSHAFYIDYETAEDFAHWYTGNCGEITQVREIEITIGEVKFDSTAGWKALRIKKGE